MKKIFITTLSIFGILTALRGQSLQIGLHGGGGLAQLSNLRETKNSFYGAGRADSWVWGLGIRLDISKNLSFETEYNYTRKGTVRYGLEQQYSYQSLPFSLRVNLWKKRLFALQPFARLGGYVARLTKQGERDLSHIGRDAIFLLEYSDVRHVDVGLTAGAGAEYRLSPKASLSIEARLEHGLCDVFGTFEHSPYYRKKVFNVAEWCILGVKYSL